MVVAVASTTTFVVTRRRRGELEATDVAETPPASPPGSTTPPTTDAQPGAPPGDVATIPPADSAPPDTAPPETATPEAATPEAATPEAATPEAATPEAATPEAATPEAATPEAATPEVGPAAAELEVLERPRLRDRLGKARNLFAGYLGSVRSREKVDDTTWEELEEALILADVGIELTTSILDGLRTPVQEGGSHHSRRLVAALRQDLVANLEGDRQLHRQPEGTNVWLFVGVNGVGKTTTIGQGRSGRVVRRHVGGAGRR